MPEVPDLRTVSVDSLVTETKLHGASLTIHGYTWPEGWPFAVVVVVAKQGNQAMLDLVNKLAEDASKIAPVAARYDWVEWQGK